MALSKDFMFEGHQFVIFRKLFEGCTLEHNRFTPNVVDDLLMNSKEAAADPALNALGLFIGSLGVPLRRRRTIRQAATSCGAVAAQLTGDRRAPR